MGRGPGSDPGAGRERSGGQAADHPDAPLVQLDGRTDINDIYAFTSPENRDNTVMIMTVNPGAGVFSPENFGRSARYDLFIDNDRDALPEICYSFRFRGRGPDQQVTMRANFRLKGRGQVGEMNDLEGGGRLMAAQGRVASPPRRGCRLAPPDRLLLFPS